MNTDDLLFNLRDAFNHHDIEAFTSCFHEDYLSEQPVHPDRVFSGREQARRNWAANFAEMPDFAAQLTRHAINGKEAWSEWEWTGTRKDSSRLLMRGVMIFGVDSGKIAWARLYVEPVDTAGRGIEAAVKEVMHGKKKSD